MRNLAKGLVVIGLALACTILTFWAMKGAHLGWTHTFIETEHIDPVTEIPYKEVEPGFVPGLDFLAAAPIAAVLFLGAAGVIVLIDSKRKKSPTSSTP